MHRLTSLLSFGLFLSVASGQPKDADSAAKWEKEIAAIEKRQTENPPKKNPEVYVGSSTIRLWDLKKSFPRLNAVNSGFGGSQIRDVTHFADRLVFKHEPFSIIFYAGDNDINAGRTPEQVVTDFKAFADAAHAKLPKTHIYFISIKPSPARWAKFDAQSKANELVKTLCEKNEWLSYIDFVPFLLGADGKPIPDLYDKDGLHLSPKGYEVLSKLVARSVD
jgi:lysophospholipase L1-like esterase